MDGGIRFVVSSSNNGELFRDDRSTGYVCCLNDFRSSCSILRPSECYL